MTLGTRYFGIDLKRSTDANGVKVAWWCIWYPRPRHPLTRLGYLYGSVRNSLPEPADMPDPVMRTDGVVIRWPTENMLEDARIEQQLSEHGY